MRVAFLTQDLQLSGGVGVLLEHAAQLAGLGFEVDLVLTRTSERPDWAHRALQGATVRGIDDARGRRYDVAVSTWWETTQRLFELDAARYACFVQSLEDRFYPPGDPRRLAASLSLDVPARFITEARWIADTLAELRPAEQVLYVRNGIAKHVFGPVPAAPPPHEGPLRILVEGNAGVPFKGVAGTGPKTCLAIPLRT